jgi:methylmalonyl-CoA/ethylmalonyl-CoA epimerase
VISDVHHVGIAVRDMTEALRFYSDALSLPTVLEGESEARGAKVALVAVGGSYLELVQPTSEASPFAAHIADRGQGLHHVGLATDDVDALMASLREKGVPLQDETPRQGFTGRLSYLAPEAFDGALLEVVQPDESLAGGDGRSPVTRIDHVVLRLADVGAVCDRMRNWFGIGTKRTFERGETRFSFLRPGDVVLELIGPAKPPESPRPGSIAGLAFECAGIDALTADLKAKGYPIGQPHPALQGGRIVSVHASGACGVPVAFIDFTDA